MDEYDTGAPTIEDDMWFHEHVRAAGYPPVKRDPEPIEGQMSIMSITDVEQVGYDLYFDKPGIWQVGTIGNTEMVTIPHAGLWELRSGQKPRFIRP